MSDDRYKSTPLTVYADYVCPFCYLGKRALERFEASRDRPLVIEWRPFDLRRRQRGPEGAIDHSIDNGKDEAYYDRVRENVNRLRADYGADEMLGIDEVPRVDSLDAQVASAYVQRNHPDSWRAFDDALYAALWEDGRDIGAGGVVRDIASTVGLDEAEISAAVTAEEHREAVFDAFAASSRQGITGVPTFVVQGTVARGAVPPSHLRRLVETATDASVSD